MGSGMIKNLALKGGFSEVVICTRTRAKAEAVAAKVAAAAADPFVVAATVRVVDTPSEVAAAASVVCQCLASEAQTETVFFGDNGLAAALTPGHIVLDHSTVSPGFTMKLHAAVAKAGAKFLDAPISGGPEGAAAGTLAIMCGGDAQVFKAAAPVLNAMGTTVKLMGGPGAGGP